MIGYVCGITHKILYSNDSLDEDDPVAQNMNRLAVFKDLRCNPKYIPPHGWMRCIPRWNGQRKTPFVRSISCRICRCRSMGRSTMRMWIHISHGYLEIEKPLQEAVWNKYLGKPLTPEEYEQVFDIDDTLLFHEFAALMDTRLGEKETELRSMPDFGFSGFAETSREFLSVFRALK